MKHLSINQISAITASFEDANFPVENLLDDKPKRIWKAGGGISGASLSVEISGASSDLAIFGTNAVQATFSVYDPNEIEWGDATDEFGYSADSWANQDFAAVSGTVMRRENTGALWIDFNATLPRPAVADIHLLADGGTELYAGVVVAGLASTYGGANVRYGVGESRIDHSIVAELANGARYYKKRDISRVFSATALMLTTQYHLLVDTFDTYGAIPAAWRLIDGSNTEWLIYGYPAISASHDYLDRSIVSIQITEVV